MIAAITIVDFEEKYQPGIDRLLDSIQNEYSEIIYAPGSKKMAETAKFPGRKYWIALYDNEVIGTVGVVCLKNKNAVLKSLMLHNDYRGSEKQVAYNLLQTAIAHAKGFGAATMYLGTMAQFEAARYFYEKYGFVEIRADELPQDFIGNPVDVVFFRYALND